jgi:beta-lactamase superfamily II metal-dependent hydrolase
MKFKIVENKRVNFDDIIEDFSHDYLCTDMKNNEIRVKYGLTYGEFRTLSEMVKSKVNLNHRNGRQNKGKFYYKYAHGFSIQKRVNGENIYFGSVSTEEMAKQAVMTVYNVQLGLAVHVKAPNGKYIIIDLGTGVTGGGNESPLLKRRYDNIGYMVITHPHLDHIDDILNFDKPVFLFNIPKIYSKLLSSRELKEKLISFKDSTLFSKNRK